MAVRRMNPFFGNNIKWHMDLIRSMIDRMNLGGVFVAGKK
jgi:hypothetical protein